MEMATLPTGFSIFSHKLFMLNPPVRTRSTSVPSLLVRACSKGVTYDLHKEGVTCESDFIKRRAALVGIGSLATSLSFARFASADEVPKNYTAFVDKIDGYSYYYPSDWRDFNFTGHDSAFKDKQKALQHVRVGFIPTTKTDVHDLGPMDEVIFNLAKNVYAAPTQVPTIYEMTERTVDGKNYWTFEYDLESPNFTRSAFATIAIGNGRYYTLIVGANQRRWSRVRNQLKVVADSFRMIDI